MNPFICRICGATEFEEMFTDEPMVIGITQHRGDAAVDVAHAKVSVGFTCLGCSVCFSDPDKFSARAQIL